MKKERTTQWTVDSGHRFTQMISSHLLKIKSEYNQGFRNPPFPPKKAID